MYAIVDIETSGGKPEHSKITEIAIYRVENGSVVDSFVSLINPDVYIPDYIVRLTGITNDMVQGAPRFYEVAKRIVEITQDTTFVAHNVGFDYGFVRAEFASLAYRFDLPTLCTVKLSRSLLPGHRSYSLGNLCNDLGIHINGRHRAGGDALATVKLFELLLDKNGGFLIPDDPYKRIDFSLFPSGIDADRVRAIPETIGVYYLKNDCDQLIYIGKSKRLRSRILDHLSGGKTQKSLKMAKEISEIDFIETGSELVALLVESDEIKVNKPLYNKALKRTRLPFGIFSYQDRAGYLRLAINRTGDVLQPLASFASYEEARQVLFKWVDSFGLCQKMCGLYDGTHGCFQYQLKQCAGACVGEEAAIDYNIRVNMLIDDLELGRQNMAIIEHGRRPDEYAVVVVENGRYLGYGYLGTEEVVMNACDFKDIIQRKDDHRDARQIIRQYLKNNKPLKIIHY
jgi:DNA polymerase III subunit epsilon